MNRFWRILLGAISVLSLLYAFYTHQVNKEEKTPVFIVEPIRTEILNSNSTQIAPIKVLTNDGIEITHDLTGLTFYFWNRGKEPVFKKDMLKEVLFELDSLGTIIDFKILKTSRDICEINLIQIDKRTLKLDFKILEHDDGFTAQIIFEGDKESQLNISTEIIGVKEISNKYNSSLTNIGTTVLKVLLGLVAIIAFFIIVGISDPKRTNEMEEIHTSPLMENNENYKKMVRELEDLTNKQDLIKTELQTERNKIKKSEKKPSLTKRLSSVFIKLIGFLILITIFGFSLSYIFGFDDTKKKTEIPTSINPYSN